MAMAGTRSVSAELDLSAPLCGAEKLKVLRGEQRCTITLNALPGNRKASPTCASRKAEEGDLPSI
jgi:hypothetical protein